MNDLPAPHLLTTAQVAARCNVTAATVLNWVKANKLAAVAKLPTPTGSHLFDPADVEALASEPQAGRAS